MTEIDVRVLSEDDWKQYKEVRLKALAESPEAFIADHRTEQDYDEKLWRDRMNRSVRLLALMDAEPVGVASVRANESLYEAAAEMFGLWVAPAQRGSGVANALGEAAADVAVKHGRRQLVYWVGTDNARAVAFASSYGFRPTEHRRTQRTPDGEDAEELAMVLALGH